MLTSKLARPCSRLISKFWPCNSSRMSIETLRTPTPHIQRHSCRWQRSNCCDTRKAMFVLICISFVPYHGPAGGKLELRQCMHSLHNPHWHWNVCVAAFACAKHPVQCAYCHMYSCMSIKMLSSMPCSAGGMNLSRRPTEQFNPQCVEVIHSVIHGGNSLEGCKCRNNKHWRGIFDVAISE